MDDEQPQQVEQGTVEEKWYVPLTRVTPLSKYLAMVLFVALPFMSFWLGVEYGKTVNDSEMPVLQYGSLEPREAARAKTTNDSAESSAITYTKIMRGKHFELTYDSRLWQPVENWSVGRLLLQKGRTLQGGTEIFASGPLIQVRERRSESDIEALRYEYETLYEMSAENGYTYTEVLRNGSRVIRVQRPALSWSGEVVEHFFEQQDGSYLSVAHYPYREGSTSTTQFLQVLDTVLLY